jgi:hypothetical protein
VKAVVACVLAAAALVAGCQAGTDGTAVRSPDQATEPTVPTPRPSRSTPTAAPTPKVIVPPSTSTPPAAEVLSPDNGYVFIQTKSGLTRCQLNTEQVGCESQFENPPTVDGSPANGVSLTAGGQVKWIVGNLGDIPAVTLDYRRYSAVGWTIDATSDGTRFTNDRTGHGMVVSVQQVQNF